MAQPPPARFLVSGNIVVATGFIRKETAKYMAHSFPLSMCYSVLNPGSLMFLSTVFLSCLFCSPEFLYAWPCWIHLLPCHISWGLSDIQYYLSCLFIYFAEAFILQYFYKLLFSRILKEIPVSSRVKLVPFTLLGFVSM